MFKSELELQNKFINLMKQDKQDHTYISDEFNARFGNVDIVKVKYDNNTPLTKKQANILSNIAAARIVGYLHKKSMRTLSYLIKNSGYTEEYILSILSKLKSANIIDEPNCYRYIINEQFEFPKLIFSSYEAKLTDWQKAISQAIKNQAFSSESYVVMPEKIAKKLSLTKKNYFSSYNVGLIAVNNNKYKILIKPRIQKNNYSQASLISSIAKYLILQKQVVAWLAFFNPYNGFF